MSTELDGEALLRALAQHDVGYIVIGGFAVIAHGVIRTTEDLDICPDPANVNLTRLARLLVELRAVQEGSEEFTAEELLLDPRRPQDLAQGGNFRLQTSHGLLDIMQWIPGTPGELAYPWLAQDAEEAHAAGVTLRVASLTKLKTMKQAAGRPKDIEDLRNLEIAHQDE